MSLATVRSLVYERVAPYAGFEGKAFWLRFWPFFLAQTFVAPLPLILFMSFGPAQVRGTVLGILMVKIGFGGLISAVLVARFFPILISPTHLRARTLMGFAFVVRWEEIQSVHPIQWMIFMPSLVLKTPFGLIWLPRYLHQQREFEDLVRQYAPPETAIGQFFNQKIARHEASLTKDGGSGEK